MSWVMVKREVLVEQTIECSHYYLINPSTLIPKLDDAQNVLNAYIATNHATHLYSYIDEYPILTRDQKDKLLDEHIVLAVRVKNVKHHYEEKEPAKVIVLSDLKGF